MSEPTARTAPAGDEIIVAVSTPADATRPESTRPEATRTEATRPEATRTEATSAEGTPDAGMPATLIRPASGRGPGIVVVQEIFGRSPYVRRRGADLAALGYTVLVPQIYWRLGIDVIDERSDNALETAVATSQRVDWDLAIADVRAAIAHLRADEATRTRVALVGFCFGGGLAYAAQQGATWENGADALVSYYGSALPNLVDGEPVAVPSLHHFGDADAFLPRDQVAHIESVVTGFGAQFERWPGANHAFDNADLTDFHDPDASAAAWEVTTAWLAENYPA
ncbi:MAG: dienelactone hydrolase family protein [Propionibacteriaceae bacterium]|nr:dienelactone hydrolase family protein [Propionibacteriaceae bacterium]